MSTTYETSDPSVGVARFFGGAADGVCIQISVYHPARGTRYVQLTRAQVLALLADLPKIVEEAYKPYIERP